MKASEKEPIGAENQRLIDQFIAWPWSIKLPIVVGTFLVFWFVTSVVPILWYSDVTRSGPFGDSFGTATSFFAFLSFAVVLISLYEQRQTNRDTIEIARKTAALQCLTFMAEHNVSLMRSMKFSYTISLYRKAANECTEAAAKLLEDMGVSISPPLPIFDAGKEASMILRNILQRFNMLLNEDYDSVTDTTDIVNAFEDLRRQNEIFKDNFSGVMGIKLVGDMIDGLPRYTPMKKSSVSPQTWKLSIDAIRSGVDAARYVLSTFSTHLAGEFSS